MQKLQFERCQVNGRCVYRLHVANTESVLSSWDGQPSVTDATILIDAQALHKAIQGLMMVKEDCYSVALLADVQSEGYGHPFCMTKIFLRWNKVDRRIDIDLETTDEVSGVLFWKDLSPFF